MCNSSADRSSASLKDYLELLPSVFFSCNNLEDEVPFEKFTHSELLILHKSVTFLDDLRFVPYEKLWSEITESSNKRYERPMHSLILKSVERSIVSRF